MLETTHAPDGGSWDADVAFHGAVAVDYGQFALRDRAYRPILTLGSLAGLVTVRPCELVLVTGTQTGRVGCTVVVADRDPGAEFDAYEDVEEVTFASPTGVVSLVERGRRPSHGGRRPARRRRDLPGALPRPWHGRGSRRRRGRGRRRVPAADLARARDAAPAAEGDQCLRALLGRAGRRTRGGRDAAGAGGIGRGASPAGRAHVTEALPANVASTYWSHLLLRPGDHVRSRRAWLVFRSDGNLVVCDEDARVRWMSGTAGRGVQAVFQIDGNLAVYNGDGEIEWASGTHGYEGNFLAVQDDGNVVVYRADGSMLWSTGTNH